MEDFLQHRGTPHQGNIPHSGRYAWGSGENAYQHEDPFLQTYHKMRDEGKTDNEIAKAMGMSSTEFRKKRSLAQDAQRNAITAFCLELQAKGYTPTQAEKEFGIPESSFRNYVNPILKERAEKTNATADILKSSVKDGKLIDVGPGVENYMGISQTKLKTAVAKLKDEGYEVFNFKVQQLGTGKNTTVQVVAEPGTDYKEAYKRFYESYDLPIGYSENGGRTFLGLRYDENGKLPSVDSSRIMVRYAEDGGKLKDGVIELRQGMKDISLGGNAYAQVRIAVDGTHYLKGMAMYGVDMPDGVDIIFNTNKHSNVPVMGDDKNNTVLKILKNDKDNPFGATVKQMTYIDENGQEKVSPVTMVASGDKVNAEGRWNEWSRTLSSQFLAKQSVPLAEKQLDLTYKRMKDEWDEIQSITNPIVKQQLELKFAEQCDSSAVHLQAAALPRQATHVILPIPDMPENEVYAPKYRNGEEVVLIRYPHGAIFEIPRLKVNNKQETANKVMKNAVDAIGINPKVAEQLSGADFDGDTVVVITTNGVRINSSKPIKSILEFDAKELYRLPDSAPEMTDKQKQSEMGKASNLITDMTIKGAELPEIIRAVKYSMVVIDAQKHHLDYKQAKEDFGIPQLKEKYQGGKNAGASTLISKASSRKVVPERKDTQPRRDIDPETGELSYVDTGRTYFKKVVDKKTGEVTWKEMKATQDSTKMAEEKDPFKLSSGTPIENVYAAHAARLKALANEARKEAIAIEMPKQNPSAKTLYAEEVASLNAKLNTALKNKPLERMAQVRANFIVKSKVHDNPNLKEDKEHFKKLKFQALDEARYEVGAGKETIAITDREWEAIQANAISANKLSQILSNADETRVRQLATPRTEKTTLTPSKEARIKSMASQNYSLADIADALGISTTTVSSVLQ